MLCYNKMPVKTNRCINTAVKIEIYTVSLQYADHFIYLEVIRGFESLSTHFNQIQVSSKRFLTLTTYGFANFLHIIYRYCSFIFRCSVQFKFNLF